MISLRSWTRDDLGFIRQLLLESWLDAYGSFIPREDLIRYLDQQYSLEQLNKFHADRHVTGLVGLVNGSLAGYAKVFNAEAEQRVYLHQIYVLPSKQRLGLGRQLFAAAAELALSWGADRLWLGVMVKNVAAFNWYSKLGFTIIETTPFTMASTRVDHHIGYVPLPVKWPQ